MGSRSRAVRGRGGLTKVGSVGLSLLGGGANTYQGITTANAGRIFLKKSNTGSNAIPGDLVINNGGTVQLGTAADKLDVRAAAFSRDGRFLATAVPGGVIQIWEVATWTKRNEFKGHGDQPTTLTFAPNGQLLSGSQDTTALAWDMRPPRVAGSVTLEMRARIGLAFALWNMDRREEAVPHVQEMLELNPDDNQGVRYSLAEFLLKMDRTDDVQSGHAEALYRQSRTLRKRSLEMLNLAFARKGESPEDYSPYRATRSAIGSATCRSVAL